MPPPTEQPDDTTTTAPLEAEREGDVVRLSGQATDLEQLGQIVAAAAAQPGVEEVDVQGVDVDQPDSGLWH